MSKSELIDIINQKVALFNEAYSARESLLNACGRKVSNNQYAKLVMLNRALHNLRNEIVGLNEQLAAVV